ncbi:MAG: hypothetical protein IKX67_05935 [Bacteroidales bacterium]|nr:hypothetical protein [Bacteroidales bacterium]
MKQFNLDAHCAYITPSMHILEIRVNNNVMLLNSNGTTRQAAPDLEEQDYSNIWG